MGFLFCSLSFMKVAYLDYMKGTLIRELRGRADIRDKEYSEIPLLYDFPIAPKNFQFSNTPDFPIAPIVFMTVK